MNTKTCSSLFVLLLVLPVARSQDAVRELGNPGQYTKFLTPGQLDRWVFEGEEGETIIAHVTSREFDPVLELTKTGAKKDDQVLLERDDPGSESRFSLRLPGAGQYKIRVHAYKFQGGGNYALRVDRFQATPLVVGEPLIGTFDGGGKGHHYFQGLKDQFLIPEVKGAFLGPWKMLDVDGRELNNWMGSVLIEQTGECSLVISGKPNLPYQLLVRAARQRDVTADEELAGNLTPGEMEVLNFSGETGDFRFVEVEKQGEVFSRLVYAPRETKTDQRIVRPGEPPPITFLPVASRGGHLRFAAILGREGRYQLQLLAQTAVSYQVILKDPSEPIARGEPVEGKLAVGGASFYRFAAEPGQLLHATLASEKFVPVLRLYDGQGSLMVQSGDAAGRLEARLTHMVLKEGRYYLQAGSLGDGGGGDFHLALDETELKLLSLGGRQQGTVRAGTADFWAFSGEEGKTVFVSVRSATFTPSLTVYSPDGVALVSNVQGNVTTGSLFALKLPKTGRYTLSVSARRGAGDYAVRLIDGD